MTTRNDTPTLIDVRKMAKKRWKGTTKEERSALMSNAAKTRWDSMSEDERKAFGAKLAEARAKKRAATKKAAKKG